MPRRRSRPGGQRNQFPQSPRCRRSGRSCGAVREEGADELVFLDITASHEGREIILDVVRRTAEVVFMPLTVGGGIRTLDDIRALLKAGCDKVSINSAACRDPEFVRQAARRFGSQCIVVNIDPKRVVKDGKEFWEVHINGGRIGTGPGGRGLGARGGTAGGGRNRPDLDGRRRHQQRLRFGDHASREPTRSPFRWWPAAARDVPTTWPTPS